MDKIVFPVPINQILKSAQGETQKNFKSYLKTKILRTDIWNRKPMVSFSS
jgi:hypothetical protein